MPNGALFFIDGPAVGVGSFRRGLPTSVDTRPQTDFSAVWCSLI
jgi:hypothetical protein